MQVPAELRVQVVGLKDPVAGLTTEKVTTPRVTAPADPLSVAVTVMPVVEPYGADIAVTVAEVGAIGATTFRVTVLDSMPPHVKVYV